MRNKKNKSRKPKFFISIDSNAYSKKCHPIINLKKGTFTFLSIVIIHKYSKLFRKFMYYEF